MKSAALLIVLLLTVACTAALTRVSTEQETKTKSDLADRINSACKKGDLVNDWTTGDEYTPVPAGTVKVTCLNTKDQTLYYVAVVQ